MICKRCEKNKTKEQWCLSCKKDMAKFQSKLKLNLACGYDIRSDCVNVDIIARKGQEEDVVIANIENRLPFNSNTFDIVYCREALQYIKPWNYFKVMEEIYRVSKHDALIHVVHKNKDTELHHTRLSPHAMRYFVKGDFYNTHTKARFEILKRKVHRAFPRFWKITYYYTLKVIK